MAGLRFLLITFLLFIFRLCVSDTIYVIKDSDEILPKSETVDLSLAASVSRIVYSSASRISISSSAITKPACVCSTSFSPCTDKASIIHSTIISYSTATISVTTTYQPTNTPSANTSIIALALSPELSAPDCDNTNSDWYLPNARSLQPLAASIKNYYPLLDAVQFFWIYCERNIPALAYGNIGIFDVQRMSMSDMKGCIDSCATYNTQLPAGSKYSYLCSAISYVDGICYLKTGYSSGSQIVSWKNATSASLFLMKNTNMWLSQPSIE